jgi:hypothetical protein
VQCADVGGVVGERSGEGSAAAGRQAVMLPPELTENEHKSMAFRAILSGKASTPKSAVPFMNALSEAGRQARVAEAKEDRK